MSPGFAVPTCAPPGASDDRAVEPFVVFVAVLYTVDTEVVVAFATSGGTRPMPISAPIATATTAPVHTRSERFGYTRNDMFRAPQPQRTRAWSAPLRICHAGRRMREKDRHTTMRDDRVLVTGHFLKPQGSATAVRLCGTRESSCGRADLDRQRPASLSP